MRAPLARVLRLVPLILALVVASACRRDSSRQRRAALETTPARRLVGVWDATLWLDRPIAPGTDPRNPPRHVVGSMAFLEDHVGSVSSEELRGSTHVGVYDIDFRPVGFQPRGPDGFPDMIARTVARPTGQSTAGAAAPSDSVSIVLDPGSSRFPLRLQGMMTADSISGTWTAGQALGGGGHFSLHRHQTVP